MEFQPSKRCRPAPAMGAQPGRRGGPAANGLDRAAGLQKYDCRPGLAARAGLDSPSPRTGRERHRAERVRRPADAGRSADRPRGASTATAPAWPYCPSSPCSSPPRPCSAPAQRSDITGAWAPLLRRGCLRLRNPPRPDRPAPRHAPPRAMGARGHAGIAWQNPAGNVLGVYLPVCSRTPPCCRPVWRPGTHARYRVRRPGRWGGPSTLPGVLDALIA